MKHGGKRKNAGRKREYRVAFKISTTQTQRTRLDELCRDVPRGRYVGELVDDKYEGAQKQLRTVGAAFLNLSKKP